jgi:hypothetical protein
VIGTTRARTNPKPNQKAPERSGAFFVAPEVPPRQVVDRWAEWSEINLALGFTAQVFWRALRTPKAKRDPGTKPLMRTHAFRSIKMVYFRLAEPNARSRRAMLKLRARLGPSIDFLAGSDGKAVNHVVYDIDKSQNCSPLPVVTVRKVKSRAK